MAKRKREKINVPMALAAVLFCLVLFSMHLTADIFARYTSRASGRDSARVASFGEISLSETGDFDSGSAMLIPGVNLVKNAKVSFEETELSSVVFIKIELSNNWAAVVGNDRAFSAINGKVTWSVAEEWQFLSRSSTSDGITAVYYLELEPNTALAEKEIIAEGGKITVGSEITRKEMPAPGTDFSIDISAAAVQSGGFETPAEAWAAIAY